MLCAKHRPNGEKRLDIPLPASVFFVVENNVNISIAIRIDGSVSRELYA
jgi:hypothetical protein